MAKKVKILRDLQLDDSFYTIHSTEADASGPLSSLGVKVYDWKERTVSELRSDDRKSDIIVINGEFRGPKLGYNGKYDEDAIFADKDILNEVVTALIRTEYEKAKKAVDDAKDLLECVEKNLKVFDPDLKSLKQKYEIREEIVSGHEEYSDDNQ